VRFGNPRPPTCRSTIAQDRGDSPRYRTRKSRTPIRQLRRDHAYRMHDLAQETAYDCPASAEFSFSRYARSEFMPNTRGSCLISTKSNPNSSAILCGRRGIAREFLHLRVRQQWIIARQPQFSIQNRMPVQNFRPGLSCRFGRSIAPNVSVAIR